MSSGLPALVSGLAVAGYAFGALLGGDLSGRFEQRRLYFVAAGAPSRPSSLHVMGIWLSA